MAKKAKGGRTIPKGTPRELLEEGSHNGRIVGCIHVGTQPSNKEGWRDQNTIYVLIEAVDSEKENGDPFVVQQRFNYINTPKSNLTKVLNALGVDTDEEFIDLEQELDDMEVIFTIEHSESAKGTFANVINISKPPKGSRIGRSTVDHTWLFLDDTFDEEVYNGLSDYYKEKIASSPEGIELGLGGKKSKGKKRQDEEEEEEEDDAPRGRGKNSPAKKTARGKSRR